MGEVIHVHWVMLLPYGDGTLAHKAVNVIENALPPTQVLEKLCL